MNNPNNLCAGDHGAAVTVLQKRLATQGFAVTLTSVYDAATEAAVRAFQVARGLVADGFAGPRTQAALAGVIDPRALTQADIDQAASTIQCDTAAIQAVIEVESPQGGFLTDGRVVILFERHEFWRQLVVHGVDPATVKAPESILSQQRGGYIGGASEYSRLAQAAAIHKEAAFASCSWGRFQIMGYHAAEIGYETAVNMAAHFAVGEGEHLRAFVVLLHTSMAMLSALREHAWAELASLYNGPAYANNLYDVRLARAYQRHAQVTA